MEAAFERAEEIVAQRSAQYGCFVSTSLDLQNDKKIAHACLLHSAGICAAVKTSKVPITVDKTEDITCEYK